MDIYKKLPYDIQKIIDMLIIKKEREEINI